MSKPNQPPSTAEQAAALNELKLKITEAARTLEKNRGELKNCEDLPVLHRSLQTQIKNVARALYALQAAIYTVPSESADNHEEKVLIEDLQSLDDRSSLQQKKTP